MRENGRKEGTVRIMLTARDVEVLLSLYKYRYLSVSQVEQLHFVSEQTARRRLRILAAAGYVELFRVPGIGDRVAALARRGIELVAENLELPREALGRGGARSKPKDHYFLRHALAVADFRIALSRACEGAPGVRLLGFVADHVADPGTAGAPKRIARDVAADIRRPTESIGHTPDGVFALARGRETALFFVEIDRGTESVSNERRGFAKTLRFYLSYLARGGYVRHQDLFGISTPFTAVRVLVATSSARRLENIRATGGALGRGPAKALRFIWLAEIAAIDERTIFNRIWVSLSPDDAASYRIGGKRDPSDSDEGALAHD